MAQSVTFYGHFSEYSGFGTAARDYVKMLVNSGYEVACRNLQYHEQLGNVGEEWVKLCLKPLVEKPDIFMILKAPWNQESMSENYQVYPEYKNAKQRIHVCIFETSQWPATWKPILDQFDKIITATEWQREAAIKTLGSQRKKGVLVIPHVVKLNYNYQPEPGAFVFLSELSRVSHRKGLDILLKAYYMAFTAEDNVILRLKTVPSQEDRLHNEISAAKKCFDWKKYPKIELSTALFDQIQIAEIWRGVDCYVCSARGEGFALSLAQAAVNNIPCLAPSAGKLTWHSEYMGSQSYYKAAVAPVVTDEWSNLGMSIDTTGMEWLEPDISDLAYKMRKLYSSPKKAVDGFKAAFYLSDSEVMKKMEKMFAN